MEPWRNHDLGWLPHFLQTLSFGTFVCLKLILVNSVCRIMKEASRAGWHTTVPSIVKRRRLHCCLFPQYGTPTTLRLGPPVLGTHAGGHAVPRVVKQANIQCTGA